MNDEATLEEHKPANLPNVQLSIDEQPASACCNKPMLPLASGYFLPF
jgi:hypothetical protein